MPPEFVRGPLDAIIHCASSVDEDDANYTIIDDNLRMAFNVLTLARTKQVQSIVNISSIAVYGAPRTTDTVIEERTGMRPASMYGVSKALVEVLLATASPEIAVAHLRLSYVLAPRMPDRYFLVRIGRLLSSGADVEIVNPDTTRFSFIEVADIARACEAVIEHRAEGPFNMAADDRPTPREVLAAVASRHPTSNSHLRFVECPERRLTATFDSTRIKQLMATRRLGDPLNAIRSATL